MNIIELCDEKTCTNCTACISVCPIQCITMEKSHEGFTYPIIDHNVCIKCDKCTKSCHILNDNNLNEIGNVYAAWSNNSDIRKSSSSGGLFSELAEYTLSMNGTVFASAFDNDLQLSFSEFNNINDITRYKGSKYVQSELRDSFLKIKKRLNNGTNVLFVGTPCQVSGLYSFLGKKYTNLLTIDLICHGVPSQQIFDKYISNCLGSKKSKHKNFYFRYEKGQGFELKTDRKNFSTNKYYFISAYKKNLMHMYSCYSCKYTEPKRIADITLGDFWGLKSLEINEPINRGISLVILNSDEGKKAFENIKSKISFYENNITEAIEGNLNLSKPSNLPEGRDTFYKDFFNLSENAIIKKYKLNQTLKDYIRPFKRKIEEITHGK